MKSLYILFAVLFLIFAISCSDNNTNNPTDSKVNILYIIDSTGHYSQFGLEAKNGMLLALKNNQNINLITVDAKSDASVAVSEFNKISQNTDIKAVITLASWVSNAIAPIAKQKNITHYAIGSAVFDNKALNNTIRFTADVEYESSFLAEYLKKYSKIALLYFVNDFGNGWKTRLELTLGNKLSKIVSYSYQNDDFRDELNSIKAENPEVLLLISTKEAAIIAKQAKASGLNAQLVGVRPTFTDYLKDEPTAEGLIFSYPEMNLSNSFFAEYLNTYNLKASAFAAEGYDVINTFANAINSKNLTNTQIFEFYKNKQFNGSLGVISFDEYAQASYKFGLMIIKNKDYEPIK